MAKKHLRVIVISRNDFIQLAYLMRLDKPIGILLLLFPTLWGLILASNGDINFSHLIIFSIGVVLMRSAGCIINDMADRKFDGFVERTKDRPLAANKLSLPLAFFALFSLLIFAFLLIQPFNALTIKLAWIGLLLAIIYPFLKRITHLPQVGLGFTFAFGIPIAFAATLGEIPPKAWLLYAAGVVWPIIYDTQYAMMDREDDLKIGIKSTAILFGKHDIYFIILFQIIFIILLIFTGKAFHLRAPFYISLLWVTLCFCYQGLTMRCRTRLAYLKVFQNHQWVGLFILLGFLL